MYICNSCACCHCTLHFVRVSHVLFSNLFHDNSRQYAVTDSPLPEPQTSYMCTGKFRFKAKTKTGVSQQCDDNSMSVDIEHSSDIEQSEKCDMCTLYKQSVTRPLERRIGFAVCRSFLRLRPAASRVPPLCRLPAPPAAPKMRNRIKHSRLEEMVRNGMVTFCACGCGCISVESTQKCSGRFVRCFAAASRFRALPGDATHSPKTIRSWRRCQEKG